MKTIGRLFDIALIIGAIVANLTFIWKAAGYHFLGHEVEALDPLSQWFVYAIAWCYLAYRAFSRLEEGKE